MPRFFKPLGGFPTAPTAKALRIGDDGDAHMIHDDGKEQRLGYVGADQRWMPSYTVEEMENLIKGGSWIEVESADADPGERPMSPAAAPKQSAGPVTVSGKAAPPAKAPTAPDAPPVQNANPNPNPKE